MTTESPSAIVAAATTLALPTVRTQAGEIADAAARDQLTHRGYLAELLSLEVDDRAERRRIRRIREATPEPRSCSSATQAPGKHTC